MKKQKKTVSHESFFSLETVFFMKMVGVTRLELATS